MQALDIGPHGGKGHQFRLPKPGGGWKRDRHRKGLRHRNGNPWDRVRPPRRRHRCLAQSILVWKVNTKAGRVPAAIRWCACGAVIYPGSSGRWLGKNLRRSYYGLPLPAWHRAMDDVHRGPASAHLRADAPMDPRQHDQQIVWPSREPDAA